LARIPHRFLAGWAPTLRTRKNTFAYEINPEIVGLLRRGRYDALVIGGYAVFTEQAAIAFARLTRTPYLIHSESHHGKSRSVAKRVAKRALLPPVIGGAAAGLAVGSRAAEYLATYGLPRERIRIFPNTIDVPAYAEAARVARAHAGEIRERLALPERFALFVGRLVEAKGVRELLAARRTGDAVPPLVVAGDGPLRGEVEASPGVTMLGFRQPSELIEIYALAERTVVPSLTEPWGVVVNEALACGSAVVASDAVGAAYDLVRPGREGLIVRAGDVGALAEALRAPVPKLEPPAGPVGRWDYDFAVAQFHEAIEIACSRR
jgi:glycosyltransferase involved in cell wall biosynthesis